MELKEFCLKTIIKYDIKCPKNLMQVNSKKINEIRKNLEYILDDNSFKYLTVKFSFKDYIAVDIIEKWKYGIAHSRFKLKNIYPYEVLELCDVITSYVVKYDIVECYKDKVIEKILELYNNGIFKFTIVLLSNECN